MGIIKPFRFISKHEIECRALDILEGMNLTEFPLDSTWVAECLGLDVVWDTIPDDEMGPIAARILPLERLIEINEAVPQLRGGFGESTIAHEIGHWVLHIDQKAVDRLARQQKRGVQITVDPLLCRNDELQGIEWQAQYFASCLLMPRYRLEEKQKTRDLTQWPELYAIAEEFGVTISNLLHRLKDLQWVQLEEGSKQLSLIS